MWGIRETGQTAREEHVYCTSHVDGTQNQQIAAVKEVEWKENRKQKTVKLRVRDRKMVEKCTECCGYHYPPPLGLKSG